MDYFWNFPFNMKSRPWLMSNQGKQSHRQEGTMTYNNSAKKRFSEITLNVSPW